MPFDPLGLTAPDITSDSTLPDELWTSIFEHGCAFPPHTFPEVMLNFIKNPNINSSHLFRADILYDSFRTLACSEEDDLQKVPNGVLKERGKYNVDLPNFELQRTVIRKLIPRNPQLDKSLVQTCHFFKSIDGDREEKNLVLYIPHASGPDEVPHYHPAVSGVAFLHNWKPSKSEGGLGSDPNTGTISIHYSLFPSTTITDRLRRTAYQLLSVLHKHGQGSLAGYVKRVHHDQIIPQQRFQDTYTKLKAKHAKRLIENWVEQTQPSKHVFEDLGIAAFLIELWKEMYSEGLGNGEAKAKHAFPGFVDIGCGNGVLVDILIKEGYKGWGFDARKRKTWDTFTPDVQEKLKQLILIPQPIIDLEGDLTTELSTLSLTDPTTPHEKAFHNGIFPPSTFIISNHADELTPWTPLLASLSASSFLAIPCCSHDLSGARFRAPGSPIHNNDPENSTNSKTGDLKDLSPHARAKQPSAYASLVAWVAKLAGECGYVVEREMLRIPSTRNTALIGRRWKAKGEVRVMGVEAIVRREGGGWGWVERAVGLQKGKGRGH